MRPDADEFVPSFKPIAQATMRSMFIPAAPPVNVLPSVNYAPRPVTRAITPNYVLPPANTPMFPTPGHTPSPTLQHRPAPQLSPPDPRPQQHSFGAAGGPFQVSLPDGKLITDNNRVWMDGLVSILEKKGNEGKEAAAAINQKAFSFTPSPPPPTPPTTAMEMFDPPPNPAWYEPSAFSVDLDKLKISTSNLASSFSNLKDENQTLKSQLADTKLKLALTEHYLKTEKATAAHVSAELQRSETDKSKIVREHEAKVKIYELMVADYEVKVADYETKLKDYEEKVRQNETLKSSKLLVDLGVKSEECAELKSSNGNLASTLADRDEEVARLKAKIEFMEEERKELNGSFEVMQAKFMKFIVTHQREMEKKKILEERLLE